MLSWQLGEGMSACSSHLFKYRDSSFVGGSRNCWRPGLKRTYKKLLEGLLPFYTKCSECRLIGHWLTRVMITIEASITLVGVTLTDSLIRWSPNKWPSVCREIPVPADKMFWTSNNPAQWTLYISSLASTGSCKCNLVSKFSKRMVWTERQHSADVTQKVLLSTANCSAAKIKEEDNAAAL
jgi:hypothetical protein